MSARRHIVCRRCRNVNRLDAGRDTTQAKCGKCNIPLCDGYSYAVDAAAFDRHVTVNHIPVIIDFWAEWCAPCKMMAPSFAAAAAEMESALRFRNVDTEAEKNVAARFQIRTIPMLMAFCKGALLAQRARALDRTPLRTWLASLPAARGRRRVLTVVKAAVRRTVLTAFHHVTAHA